MSFPTLPPIAGTATSYTAIHGVAGSPTLTDLGLAGNFAGGVIQDLKTSWTNDHQILHDRFMHKAVDILSDLGMDIEFNFEVWARNTGPTGAPPTDPGVPTMQVGTLIDGDVVQILLQYDTRGFGPGTGTSPGTLWADGTKFLVMEANGSFERNKPRKDAVKLSFRNYGLIT
jgi:hypothetical protein